MESHLYRPRRRSVRPELVHGQSAARPLASRRRSRALVAAVAAASAAMLPPAAARADGPAASPPINILTGVVHLNTGNDTVNGTNVNNYSGGIFVYGDGNIINNNDSQGQIPSADFIVDDAGGPAPNTNYFGSTLITLNGGTFEYHGQPGPGGAGTPSTTVTNMAVATGGVINAQPQGGGGYLQITNLTVAPQATVTFESSWGSLGTANPNDGNTDDIGKINLVNLNGKALVNQNGLADGTSIIGGWATTVSYANAASGLMGFASANSANGTLGITEVTYDFDGVDALTSANGSGNPTGTMNIRTVGGGAGGVAEVLDGSTVPNGQFAYNSLVSNGGPGFGDINLLKGAQLVLNSGGLIMGDGGHWIKSDDGTGTLTAGAGGNFNLYASTNLGGANSSVDFRIFNVQITDNGTHPVTLIKGGTGVFRLDPNSRGHETYTGGTIINDGTLEILVGGQTGTFMPGTKVTINAGGILQSDAGDGLGWGDNTPGGPGPVTVTVNPGGILLSQYNVRQTMNNTITLIGGTLESTPGTFNPGDGVGSFSFVGTSMNGFGGIAVTATSSPVTGPSKIIAPTIALQNNLVVFNVTNGGNGVPDLVVNSTILNAQFNFPTHTLVKQGNGTLVLNAPSVWTPDPTNGGTQVNAGILRVTNINALSTGLVTLGGGTLQTASSAPLTSAGSSVSGFANFSLNGNTVTGSTTPSISTDNSTLFVTDAINGEQRSAFFKTPISVTNTGGFTASFTYQDTSGNGSNPADGVALVLQNDPKGTAALGGGGGALGWAGIANSAAAAFNVYNGAAGGRGIAFNANGIIAPTVNNFNGTTAGVDLSSGDPINITVTYNGLQHTVTVAESDPTSTNNPNTFTYTFYGVDYNAILGGTSAFVGFTGGTGGLNANQQVSNFNFTSGGFTTAPATDVYPNAVAVVADSTIDMNNGRSVTFGTLAIGANNLTITSSDTGTTPYTLNTGAVTLSGNATFTVNKSAGGAAVTLAPGAIGGAFGITKAGAGTLLLAANSNYSGPTNITGGVVLANNATSSTGTGVVTVQSGAKLGGTGTITGATTVGAGGVISAGDAAVIPGKLSINAPTTFTLGSGAVGSGGNGTTYLWKINSATGGAGASTGWDELQLQTLAVAPGTGGTVVTIQPVSFNGSTPGGMAGFNSGQTFRWAVINVPSAGALPPASNFVLDTNALSAFAAANNVPTSSFSILEGPDPSSGNDVFVQFSPAPEPTGLMLLGLGAAGLLLRRRRLGAMPEMMADPSTGV